MKYKKKRLTDKQFQINNRQKFDTRVTDSLLIEHGLDIKTFATMPIELVRARIVAVDLLKNYSIFLTEDHIKALKQFNQKVTDKNKLNRINPTLSYPILNLGTKIKRQAHKQHAQTKQKIK